MTGEPGLLAIQGNIIPFLRSELHLGYGAITLGSPKRSPEFELLAN